MCQRPGKRDRFSVSQEGMTSLSETKAVEPEEDTEEAESAGLEDGLGENEEEG